MYPIGESKLITIVAKPGVLNAPFRPAEGNEWIVCELCFWHDDPISRSGYWKVINAAKSATSNSALVAQYVRIPFSLMNGPALVSQIFNPIRITHLQYCQAVLNTLAAVNVLHIDALVIERPENIELQLIENIFSTLKWQLPGGLIGLKSRLGDYRSGQ